MFLWYNKETHLNFYKWDESIDLLSVRYDGYSIICLFRFYYAPYYIWKVFSLDMCHKYTA